MKSKCEIIASYKTPMYSIYSRNLNIAVKTLSLLSDVFIYNTLYDFISNFYENTENGSKLIMFGNGGSAADCDHIVGEFMNRFMCDRKPVMAMSLANSSSTVTAIGNDFNYDKIFSRQLDGIIQPNDSVIALTTSGKSKNIINALDFLKDKPIPINSLIITGDMNTTANGYKYHIKIPIECNKYTVARIQEATMFLLHVMCGIYDSLWQEEEYLKMTKKS